MFYFFCQKSKLQLCEKEYLAKKLFSNKKKFRWSYGWIEEKYSKLEQKDADCLPERVIFYFLLVDIFMFFITRFKI